jgi:ATP-dependent DNA ligase
MSPHPADFTEPCLPTVSRTDPTGAGWAYEIKHDGFRFLAGREGKRVRVYCRTRRDRFVLAVTGGPCLS